MRGARRADPPGWIGRGGGNRAGRGAQQRLRQRMRRNPDRHIGQPRRNRRANPGTGAQRQHQRQRAGPEPARQRQRPGREHRNALRCFQIRHMHDQRVELRAALGGKDAGNRSGIRGIPAQTVNRFGRERDQCPRPQQRRALCHPVGRGRKDLGLLCRLRHCVTWRFD